MGHLYGDPIEVRGADGAVVTRRRAVAAAVCGSSATSGPVGDGPTDPSSNGSVSTVTAPASFLWRGRVYLVRGVLARWRERLPWWASTSARLARGDLPADLLEGSGEGRAEETDGWLQPFRGARAGGDDRPVRGSGPRPAATPVLEREVWRVEASCGRQFPAGVFDLCRELSAEEVALLVDADSTSPCPPDRWHLLRVCD